MTCSGNRQDGRAAVRVVVRLALAAVLGVAGVLGATRSSDHAPGLALEKLDRVLQRVVAQPADGRSGVIVRAASGVAGDAAAAVTARGGVVEEHFRVIGAVRATLRHADLVALAGDPRVASVSSDGVVETAQNKGNGKGGKDKTTTTTSDSTATSDSGGGSWQTDTLVANHLLNTLGLDDEPWDGKGVNVAIIDSGIDAFYELSIHGTYSFLNGAYPNDNQWVGSGDPYGHGTHVAGLIANDGAESGGEFRGVAPGMGRIYSLRVLDDHGAGYTSDVIRAIEWAIQHTKANFDIINLSLGHPIFEPAASDPLVQAVEAAVRAGIVVVVSAGNYGYDRETGVIGYAGITSPGNAPSAITVGAIDTLLTDTRLDDSVPRYSSRFMPAAIILKARNVFGSRQIMPPIRPE